MDSDCILCTSICSAYFFLIYCSQHMHIICYVYCITSTKLLQFVLKFLQLLSENFNPYLTFMFNLTINCLFFLFYLHIQTYGQTNPWSTLSVCRYYIDIIKVYPIGLDKNLYSPTQRAFKWRKINKDFHFFKKLLLTLPECSGNNPECLIPFLDSKGLDKNFDHYR